MVVAAVIAKGQRILAARRLAGGAASEKWEFPGGKVEKSESLEAALKREIQEELGLEVTVGALLGIYRVEQGSRTIVLSCFLCGLSGGSPTLSAHSEIRWLLPSELPSLDWAEPDVPAVEAIVARFGSVPRASR